MYENTDGANWRDNTGWIQDEKPCQWHGIICKDGYVDEINLAGDSLDNLFGLDGTIPVEVTRFQELKIFNVSFNSLVVRDRSLVKWLNELDPNWIDTQSVRGLTLETETRIYLPTIRR